MDLVGYCRASSAEHQSDGRRLETQELAILQWAKARGHRIVAVYSDVSSGSVLPADQPGLSAALAALRSYPHATGLVVLTLDRLAGELLQQEAALQVAWRATASVFVVNGGAEATGEVLACDPDQPTRTMVRRVLGLIGEYERDLNANATFGARRPKATRGHHAGGRYAFGTRAEGKGKGRDAVEDESEQQIIARILEMRQAGLSYRQVAAALDAAGVSPRRAESWSAASIRLIAERARASD